MKNRMIMMIATALVGFASFAPIAQAQRPIVRSGGALPWSYTDGKPYINTNKAFGFYIWHVGDTVYLVTSGESDHGRKFEGKIVVQNGSVSRIRRMNDEALDNVRQNNPHEVGFRFETHDKMDGIKFKVNGGTRITFNLELNDHRTIKVYMGGSKSEVAGFPLVFNMNR